MIRKEEVFKIGRIGKPHGVRGEVQMQITDDVFDRVDADCLVLDIDGILVPFFIESYRFRSDEMVLMKLDDIDTEDDARELTGCDVYFLRRLAENDGDDVSNAEIIGYDIIDAATGNAVGTITSVDDSTANILFSVTTADGRDILIPAVADFIKDVDKAKQQITMDIPEGLLDL